MRESHFIYFITPADRDKRTWKGSLPGALLFVGGWILLSMLFSIYVSNMANYNRVYGSLGAIVVLMIWLYFTSFTLLIGAQVNALLMGCDTGRMVAPPQPEAPPAGE